MKEPEIAWWELRNRQLFFNPSTEGNSPKSLTEPVRRFVNSKHFLISGVPAAGKTWLGNWLANKRGYVHIDAEKDYGTDFDHAGVHAEWDDFLRTGRAAGFVAAVGHLGKSLVLNWGLPSDALFIVPALQAEGVEAWWIHADRSQARTAFVERENKKPEGKRISVELFDQQMDQIERHWLLIERLFGKRMIEGLKTDGSQRLPEDLWTEITARRGE